MTVTQRRAASSARDTVLGAAMLQALFDSVYAEVSVLDEDGRIVGVNAAWRAFTQGNDGDERACGVGVSYLDACDRATGVSAAGAGTVARYIRELLAATRDDAVLEYPCHAPEQQRWFVARFSRFVIDGCRYVVVTHTDITERRLASEALRAGEQRLRCVLDGSFDGIWTLDAEGRTDYANGRLAALLGTTPQRMVGRSFFEFVDADSLELAVRLLQEHRVDDGKGTEFRFRRLDGARVEVGLTLTSLHDGNGDYAGVLAVVEDLTRLKEAERRLRESEEHFRLLVEVTSDIIFRVDSAGTIGYASPAVEAALGHFPSECTGHAFASFAHPDDMAVLTRQVTDGESAQNRPLEIRLRHRDGSWRTFDVGRKSVNAIDDAASGAVLTARDVTERNRLESHVLQSQKTEAALAIANGIAHDFNNMFTTMQCSLDALLAAMSPNDARRTLTSEIAAELQRASRLSRQLQRFGRHELPEQTALDLVDVVRDMRRLLQRQLGDRIELSLDLPEGTLSIFASRGEIEQALLNLVANAGDALPSGGRVTIRVFIGQDMIGDDRVVLAVRDTGPGIPEELRQEIFKPFFSTKGEAAGSGLGLSAVHTYVLQCGGDVEVDSDVGVGTEFRLSFPLIAAG
jgi:PAS domain S-box-containing protein